MGSLYADYQTDNFYDYTTNYGSKHQVSKVGYCSCASEQPYFTQPF